MTKPVIRSRSVTEGVLLFRCVRFLAKRNAMVIRRRARSLGPVFVLDLDRGVVTDRGIPDVETLARQLGLLASDERVVTP